MCITYVLAARLSLLVSAMIGTIASKITAAAALLLVSAISAETLRGSIAEISPPPIAPVDPNPDAMLVATMTNGEIETHWLPRKVCERVASELRAGSRVSGTRQDGTQMFISRANCSLRNAQLIGP